MKPLEQANRPQAGELPHIFPFFWLHGEPEEVLREYMGAIHNANISGVCVESRPHPDFCGPRWWQDMEIILDEARKRQMKVWILDDSHFPTGFANGALKGKGLELRRQFLVRAPLGAVTAGERWEQPRDACCSLPPWEPKGFEGYQGPPPTFPGDRLLGVAALRQDRPGAQALPGGEVFSFQPEEGQWQLYALALTYNRGPHRDYINMLDKRSCRLLLDAVYEPHWEHFQKDFGETIAGFFSDEPELGNGHLYEMGKKLWEMDDLPWSRELEEELSALWGEALVPQLALLWDREQGAAARCAFMDHLTRLVERNFSRQVGDWCRRHGVAYIGHLIEDNGSHQCTGSSLGHYFRGLAGQDMAGIDDIGGQVLPQGEFAGQNGPMGQFRDGFFYHYVLGKLGASLAAIDPGKRGRCMCEIFGAYGWEEGVRLEKYLVDHFLVRGVNYFVPHAFSAKPYPDPDCPPHFYAQGHDPLYRHFGALMAYTTRVAKLFTGGKSKTPVALLYTAEADWAGETTQLPAVAMPLYDRQIDYHILPADVFAQPERYGASWEQGLTVNGQEYRAVVAPQGQYLPQAALPALQALCRQGFPVLLAGELPAGQDAGFPLVAPANLPGYLDGLGVTEVFLDPPDSRVRCLVYQAAEPRVMLVNEGTAAYRGKVSLPVAGPCCAYNAWEDRMEPVQAAPAGEGTEVDVALQPLHSLILLFREERGLHRPFRPEDWGRPAPWDGGWTRSTCPSVQYPRFTGAVEVSLPDHLAQEQPEFSGFVRYEKAFPWDGESPLALEITDAYEGVEAFLNGESLGIQIAPPFWYDFTGKLRPGENRLAIEVATTLERENAANPNPMRDYLGLGPKVCETPSGINGKAYLYQK